MRGKSKKKSKEQVKYKIDVCDLHRQSDFLWLLKWLFSKSKMFSMIEIPGSEYSQNAYNIMLKLTPFIISKKVVSEWPGTLYPEGAIEYVFKSNENTQKILSKSINSFNQLQMPYMMEDISFYLTDGSIIFYSTTHEDIEYLVNLSESDVNYILNHVKIEEKNVSVDEGDY